MAQFPLIDQASLVMIPGAYKEGKIYSQLPTDGSGDFTYTRGTDTATRVNENGLIEKERVNLLLQSNQFDTAWGYVSASAASGYSGYDGSSDAWLLTKTGASGRVYQNLSASGVLTYSVYMKANASTWGLIQVDGSPSDAYVYVDLSNGVFGSVSSHNITESLEDIGNGWYRVSLSVNDTATRVRIYPAETNSASATSGSIYIQDAQLEQGLVATDYIETTTVPVYAGLTDNMPRLDYTDATCPSLLLEPSRTQLVTQSEYFNSSDWISSSNVTITDNVTTSPEGVQNASLINFTSSGNYFQHNGSAIVSGATYTISCYVKRAISTDQVFKIYGNNNKSSANLTATSEWQRFSHTFTADSTNFASGFSTPSTCQIHLYGFQVEQGSYPTSYIPTYGSTQTRAADVSSVTKAVSSEGSLFINIGGTSQPKLSVLEEYFDASTTANKVAIAYSSTALVISHNGSIVVDKTGTYDVSSLTQIQLGHSNGLDQADSPISEFVTFDSFLTNSELNALTQ